MDRFQVTVAPELEPIMTRYMEIRRQELKQLEAALDAGDSDAVRELGHTLKGTGASYGFDFLTELGAAIEGAGRCQELDFARELGKSVRDYIEHVDIIYKK
ncbi:MULTISPECIES: Hpt domain-containing protein [unclassified Pseudodesulfovibrio]|uniref:Hpt domain-containing protein n=1 Tax=unclassified Pseudodesulfovibrio TaxID=2661612 RepID=UPI000FEB868B|nr:MULTISPECIES: Hpt domain-containing protein [unclassified Pseudodesulfovibrio]MCJ2165448.1 Hpt domain-containing protein [Pseudodesulfovibrio sp. S3-i]RWU03198.1 Hpt domain-containing protein [Pseudodesulfovibrio sp. S3]